MVCRDERVMADVEPGEGRGRGGVGGGYGIISSMLSLIKGYPKGQSNAR